MPKKKRSAKIRGEAASTTGRGKTNTLSCAVALQNVVDHIANRVCIRQVDHRDVDFELLENLTLELSKRDRVGSAGSQRFSQIYKFR